MEAYAHTHLFVNNSLQAFLQPYVSVYTVYIVLHAYVSSMGHDDRD